MSTCTHPAPPAPDLRLAVARAAGSWPVVGAVGLMALNDHVLKHVGYLPSVVTGKLSDFAFLFFAPVLTAFVLRASRWSHVLGCAAIPALLLVTIDLSPGASACFAAALSVVVPTVLWPDPTDLLALASVPVALGYVARLEARGAPQPAKAGPGRVLVTAVAALSCVATSPRVTLAPPTHQPIYMSWEHLRSAAVDVLPPRPLEKPGKIVVQGDYLFVSDVGKGIHVIDNSDPTAPRPLLFLRIPGNVDLALQGNTLYADSFVDLLVFELQLERGAAVLVERLEDQFAYDPYQVLDHDAGIVLAPPDFERGVVVGARPLAPQRDGEVRP